MTNQLHLRCGEEVSFDDVSKGYYAQCPECDEDVFYFETEGVSK
jgi:DNA-directed RNA polymerase subunit RPC12/RpoP